MTVEDLIAYVDSQPHTSVVGRLKSANRVRQGYLTVTRHHQGAKVVRESLRLRDSRMAGGRQYSPIFQRYLDDGSFQLRGEDGRYTAPDEVAAR